MESEAGYKTAVVLLDLQSVSIQESLHEHGMSDSDIVEVFLRAQEIMKNHLVTIGLIGDIGIN